MPRMTSKGQVTIPKRVRDYLGLKPGAEIQFECEDEDRVVLKAAEKRQSVGRFDRFLGSAGPGMTTEELMRLTRGWGEPDYDVK